MTEEQINDEQRTETDLMQFVPKVHFEQIPIRNLVSNQEYQRNLSQHHVKNAASHFDLYQINPVKVSRRDGINYVFNGQHTIEIVALVSGSRETPVWCMVYDDLEYEHEADIFANQMKYVKPLLPYEIFMANIEAGNDKQLIIRDLVESYDLTITSTTAPGGICAVATLENIHDKYGYHMLDHVIRLIAATWEGASQSFSANMMNGLARFLNAYVASRNLFFRQFLRNLCRIDADKEIPVDASYRFCLFLIDDQLPVLILIVAQELECIQVHLTILEFGADAPFAVLRNVS